MWVVIDDRGDARLDNHPILRTDLEAGQVVDVSDLELVEEMSI